MSEFNRGATVTPDVSYDASGQEVISYDNASIAWAGERDAVLTEFDRHQDELITQSAYTGELEHEFDGDYSQEFLEGGELPPSDIEQLVGIAGGEEAYGEMIQWASQNLSPEDIQAYDVFINSNDYELMEEAISNLYSYYLENFNSDVNYEDQEPEPEQLTPQEQADYEFNQSVLNELPHYQDMIQWASQNLSQEQIRNYDRAMDLTDHNQKAQWINWLEEAYQQSN